MEILKPKCFLARLTKIETLNDYNFCYHFQLPNLEINMKPGQFIMIKLANNGIRIPIQCIQDNHHSFKLILSKLRDQHQEILNLKINDSLDCLMPLGRTINLHASKENLICVTEEFLPFAYNLAKILIANNKNVSLLLSFHKNYNICLLDEFKKLNIQKIIIICDEIIPNIESDPISLLEYLDETNIYSEWVYLAIRPDLIKAVDNWFCQKEIGGNILYKEFMACGFGICNGCTVVKKNNTVQKCCLNPFFKLGEIVYE